MLRSLPLILSLLVSHVCISQLVLDKTYYARLVIPEDAEAEVMFTRVEIDTLIMDDNSSLRFTMREHTLLVKHARLRGSVDWKGAGRSGEEAGSRGEDGTDLRVTITFYELGRLLIDTRGGAGSIGKTPKTRAGYYTTEPAGNGGNGGDGGDINFTYKCIDFTPQFDRGKKNAIHVKSKGGSGGSGGFANKEHNQPKISAGPQGAVGNKGKNGEVVMEEM